MRVLENGSPRCCAESLSHDRIVRWLRRHPSTPQASMIAARSSQLQVGSLATNHERIEASLVPGPVPTL